jgi:hypothetical protein
MSSYLIPISCPSIIKANSKNYTSMYLWAVSSNSTITSKKTAAVSREQTSDNNTSIEQLDYRIEQTSDNCKQRAGS